MNLGILALFPFFAWGQGGAGSAHFNSRTEVPPRVTHARRFLGKRGWPRYQPRRLGDRPRPLFSTQTFDASVASTAIWQPLGPSAVISPSFGLVTGRVSSIAIDPSDTTGNRVYIGTTGGGVWVSQNAGTAGSVVFTPLTDAPAAFDNVRYASISIGAISVQPGGTGVILAGTGDSNDALDSYYGAGVLRSADGGSSWTVMSHTADQMFSFQGEGFSGFAWSTVNPQVVVAAVSEAYEGTLVSAQLSGVSYAGIYYSTDAGATWSLATISDSPGQNVQGRLDRFASPSGNSATSIVWNPIRHMFIAAIRFHGYYQSVDGATWTRISTQPGSGMTTKLCPTNQGTVGSLACPVFRGALAVNPLTGDTFAWTVDVNNQDQGLWEDTCALSSGTCSNETIAFSGRWSTAPLETNTRQGAATILDGDYNLVLAAVPAQQDTMLLAGGNDLWRCSLAMGCSWRNTTNATTCMSAQVAPYQHALAWNPSNPQEIFIGNDSGLWRSTDGIGETGANCSPTDQSHFQNLNAGIGSLAEVESMSQVGASSYTMMAGLGANGTAGVKSILGPTENWPQILGGEGGPVAMDRGNPATWFVNNSAGVSIYRCGQAADCTPGDFGSTAGVNNEDVAGDGYTMTFPAPFIIDPLDSNQLLIGTCRLWRGPANGHGWTGANAISRILDGISGLAYCSGDALIHSLAALPLSNGSEVIYAGMFGTRDGGATLGGHIFRGIYDPSGSSMPDWQDLTLNPVLNDQVQFNSFALDVSSIYVDPHDVTGNTVYVTIAGAEDSRHAIRILYGTIDGGAHWSELTSNLPHSPGNAVVVDPQDANTVYVATDEGVYSTRQIASCNNGPSNCWSVFGTGLPFAPVVQLSAAPATASPNVLVAGTYGRGIWQVPLWTSGTQSTTISAQPSSATFAAQPVGTTSSSQTITLTNTGAIALLVGSISATPNFSEADNCTGHAIGAGSACVIQASFTPVGLGDISGQLKITANVSGGQILIPLSGLGVSAGYVTALPGILSFGQVEIGKTSPALPITVENSSSSLIPVSSITVTPPFVLTANGCGPPLSSGLAANSDCALSVSFAPTSAGDVNGTLTIVDGAGTQTVVLTGTGASAAGDSLSPASLDFPPTASGQRSAPQIITLTNSGDMPLTSIAITVSAGFQESNTCGTQLTAHASCAINVVFEPAVTGRITGSLRISDALRTQTIALNGIGLVPPAMSVNPSELNFPASAIGQAATPVILTISNVGGSAMSDVGFQITGQSASSFSWGGSSCGAMLNAGSSCVVQIGFTPATAGVLTAALVVTSSTTNVTPVQVSLKGVGKADGGIAISPVELVFTQPTLGRASEPQTVNVLNSSNIVATGLVVSVSSPFSLVQNYCGSALAAGASCSAEVAFTPTANAIVTGSLNITSPSFLGVGSVILKGIGGAAGSMLAQPASRSFPMTGVGNTSGLLGITLTNNGTIPLTGMTISSSRQFQIGWMSCSASLDAGASCALQVAFSPSNAGPQTGNLTVSSSSLAVPVVIPLSGTGFDFSVSFLGQSSQTISSGQTGNFSFQLATMSGSSGTFTFACSGLPLNSACIFNPISETITANATGSATVKIATGVSAASAQNVGMAVHNPRYLLLLSGLLLVPWALKNRRSRFYLLVLLLFPIGLASCAGAGGGGGAPPVSGSKSTPAGTYPIVVTATANGLSRKITLNLTVD